MHAKGQGHRRGRSCAHRALFCAAAATIGIASTAARGATVVGENQALVLPAGAFADTISLSGGRLASVDNAAADATAAVTLQPGASSVIGAGANGELTISAGLGGAGAVRFSSAPGGAVRLTGANTLAGALTLGEGMLFLSDDASAAGNTTFAIERAGALVISNGGAVANPLSASGTITLLGGSFAYLGETNAASYILSGGILAPFGASSIAANPIDVNTLAELHLGGAGVTRSPGATVDFSGRSLGQLANNARIYFATAPTLQANLIGPWATVGNDFATYDPIGGIKALTTYNSDSADSGWSAGSNIRRTVNAATTTLTGSRTINSLKLGASNNAAFALNGKNLTLVSGGFISSTPTQSLSGAGRLTTTAAELIIINSGNLDLSAAITKNAGLDGTFGNDDDGGFALVKSGAGILTLSGANTYGGSTTVNAGTLVTPASSLSGPDLAINGGLVSFTDTAGQIALGTVRLRGGDAALHTAGAAVNAGVWDIQKGTIDAPLAGSAALHKTTGGLARITGDLSDFSGGIQVDAGILEIVRTNDHAFAHIAPGATLRLSPGSTQASALASLLIDQSAGAPIGKVDVGAGGLVLESTLANRAVVFTQASDWLKAGRGTSNFFANYGITSSAAQGAVASGLAMGVGLRQNDDGTGNPLFPTFLGAAADANATLIRFTYDGDLNLDGRVDGDDVSLLITGINDASKPRTWAYGDMNYDGRIDADDVSLLIGGLGAYQANGALGLDVDVALDFPGDAAPRALAAQAVPEPTSAAVWCALAFGICRRRRISSRP